MAYLTKDAIIQQHELLTNFVVNQKISLRDQENFLRRLEEIARDITTNRQVTKNSLHKWEKQLATIKDDITSASSKLIK